LNLSLKLNQKLNLTTDIIPIKNKFSLSLEYKIKSDYLIFVIFSLLGLKMSVILKN
jgi:hypothetical protein